MKIECAWCEADLGEKCPSCGSTDIISVSLEADLFCTGCRLVFKAGQGGITSTICARCRQHELRNLPGRLTCDEIVERAAKREFPAVENTQEKAEEISAEITREPH